MSEEVLNFLFAIAGGLILAYGTKKISDQSSKISKLRADYAIDKAEMMADHDKQVAVMEATYGTQITSLKEYCDRLKAEIAELRTLYAPAQAGIRIRDDYILLLRHGYTEFGKQPPPYPAELRGA